MTSQKMLPNFIIPGAMKSGTTALRHYLAQHPSVFIARREVHFFDDERAFRRGTAYYESFFARHGNARAVGEKTPAYLCDENAAGRMHAVVPGVRLVFLFRNPVDRAYSHYWHNVRMHDEQLDFEGALDAEDQRLKDANAKKTYSYKLRGRYAFLLQRFMALFAPDQMFFMTAEQLRDDTRHGLERVLRFLDVDSTYTFRDLGRRHVGGTPRSRVLVALAGMRLIYRSALLRGLVLKINTGTRGVPPMKESTRRHLCEYFRVENRELEAITGLDLGAWHDGG